MNPKEALKLLLDTYEKILASGQTISEPVKIELAKTMERLYFFSNAPKPPPELSQLEKSMPSSNVEGFAYDDKNGKLFVRFLGKYPNRNGPIYSYQGVPPEIFQLFKTGAVPARTNGRNKWGSWWKGKHPSMGASLYTLLKTANYPYQRVA